MDVVEATNIYLVVFKEGICTFHFEDISAHTEAVRKRLLRLEETIRVSSGKYLADRSNCVDSCSLQIG